MTLKEGRWAYEREASSAAGQGEIPGPTRRRRSAAASEAAAGPACDGSTGSRRPAFPGQPERLECTLSSRCSLSGPLYRLAGSGLASGGFVVFVDSHEVGRLGGTAYWVCLDSGSRPSRLPPTDGLCGWMASGETHTERRGVTARRGRRNG
jgi:hypothetical protein